MIAIERLKFAYGETPVIDGITLKIAAGERIALMGANGSGKSTLGLLIKGLLIPDEGEIIIDGIIASDSPPGKMGLVFQNPEDQIAAATVEREIAFGLENLGVERSEMIERVERELKIHGLEDYRRHPPHLLSGGQMQKLALAAVMVMEPDYLILDEPTALLDPLSRKEFLNILKTQSPKIGIIYITQFSSEAMKFERIVALAEGKIHFDGKPEELFRRDDILKQCSLEPPVGIRLENFLGKS